MNMKHFFTLLLIVFLIGFVHASDETDVADQAQATICVLGPCPETPQQDTTSPEPLLVQEKIPINKTIQTGSQPEPVLRSLSAPLSAANTMETLSSESDWDVAIRFDNVFFPNHFYPFSSEYGTVQTPYFAKFDTTDTLVRWIPYCSGCQQDPEVCTYWAGIAQQDCIGLGIPCLSLDPFTTTCSCFDGIPKGARMDGWFVERKRISDTRYEVHIAGQATGAVYPYGELWLNPDSGWTFTHLDACNVQKDQTGDGRPVLCALTSDTALQFQAAGNCDSYCACEDSGYIYIIVTAEKTTIEPVPTPLDLIEKLIQYISSQDISKLPKKILVGQLEGVKKLLQNNRQCDAVLGMRGFVLSVHLFERSALTREQAGAMRTSADEIIAAINLPVNQQAVDMTRLLRADVNGMNLPALKQKLLVLELDGTILMLECAKDKEAVDHLNVFIKTVTSCDGKGIPHDNAVHLKGEAADIINTIGNKPAD
jgi:hypothetical protein